MTTALILGNVYFACGIAVAANYAAHERNIGEAFVTGLFWPIAMVIYVFQGPKN